MKGTVRLKNYFILILASGFIIVPGLFATTFWIIKEEFRTYIEQDNITLATSVSEILKNLMSNPINSLISVNRNIENETITLSEFNRSFESFDFLYPYFESILLLDNNGIVKAAYPETRDIIGIDLSFNSNFVIAL